MAKCEIEVTSVAEGAVQWSGPQNIALNAGPVKYTTTGGGTTSCLDCATGLDIDNDGNLDFGLFLASITASKYGTSPGYSAFFGFNIPADTNAQQIVTATVVTAPGGTTGPTTTSIPVAKALVSGYAVSNTATPPATWTGYPKYGGLGFYASGLSFGQFPGQGNRFIGVQFQNNGSGQTHFGWIQVNLAANFLTLTIVDWAWEDVPDTPILAGATSGGGGAQVVPTLNEWGLMLLTTLLAGAAVLKGRKLTRTA